MKNEKKNNNIINFPNSLTNGEREVEAILFAAAIAAGAEVAFVMAKGYRRMRSVAHPEILRFRQPYDQLAFQLIK